MSGMRVCARKTLPAFQVPADERVLDEAHDRVVVFQRPDRRQDGGQGAVAVEVIVQPEAGRSNLLHDPGLLHDIVDFRSVHLEDRVALRDGPLHLLAELRRRSGPRPGGDGHAVAHLLPHQLVGRYPQVLPHHVVQGAAESGVEVIVDEVERATTDQRLDRRPRRCRAAIVAVAGHSRVGLNTKYRAPVDSAKAHLILLIASSDTGIDRNDLDSGNLHRHTPPGQPRIGRRSRVLGTWPCSPACPQHSTAAGFEPAGQPVLYTALAGSWWWC